MKFLKGHATGNDFVLLPDPDGHLNLSTEEIIQICDRRRGIGGDGLIRVVRTQSAAPQGDPREWYSAEWYMEHWNSDGSPAPTCGNGLRLQGRYLVEAGRAAPGRIPVATRAGVYQVEVPREGEVTVHLGEPTYKRAEYPLPDRMLVELGTKHEVVVVQRLPEEGELVGNPEANVEYVEVLSPRQVRMRVVERGVGETLSCGTGACAAVAATGRMRHLDEGRIEVLTRGGTLQVTREGGRLSLTGEARIVAEGTYRP